jgi:hypothetical protein
MTALDMLIPRKTDIGSVDIEKDFNNDSTSKYSQAMRFLRSKESILTPDSEIKGSRVQQVKDKLQGQGIQGTVVDRYVEKQLAWSVARGEWDAVRAEAQGESLHFLINAAQLTMVQFQRLESPVGNFNQLHYLLPGKRISSAYAFTTCIQESRRSS